MKNSRYVYVVALCIGAATMIISVAVDIIFPRLASDLGPFRWVFVGLGAGLVGGAASKIIRIETYKTDPKLARQARINENDERNINIKKTAAYYMWFITLLLICAMTLIFVAFNLSGAALLSTGVLAVHIVLYIVLLARINKRM